jgi:hypothetical protein
MGKKKKDRDMLKSRIQKWMFISGVDKQRDALDMMINETFIHVYDRLEDGETIQDIGNDLGVFPLP